MTRIPDQDDSGPPIWWHHHGSKMRLVAQRYKVNKCVALKGSVAELKVGKLGKNCWLVTWKVIHGPDENSFGRIFMDDQCLAAAFGLDNTPIGSRWLIERFGGTVARQGKFIRSKNYLNIPCPGTGHDGDPNVSVELNAEIISAVSELLSNM